MNQFICCHLYNPYGHIVSIHWLFGHLLFVFTDFPGQSLLFLMRYQNLLLNGVTL